MKPIRGLKHQHGSGAEPSFSAEGLHGSWPSRRRHPYSIPLPRASPACRWLRPNVIGLDFGTLFTGTIGAISVFKAAFIDWLELRCTWVGGDSNAPLGLVFMTENLIMIGVAI